MATLFFSDLDSFMTEAGFLSPNNSEDLNSI